MGREKDETMVGQKEKQEEEETVLGLEEKQCDLSAQHW